MSPALLAALVFPFWLPASGGEEDPRAASWRTRSSAHATLPRLVYMQAFPMVQGKDSGGVREWLSEEEPLPWNAWMRSPERMLDRVGTGEFLYGTTDERPVLLCERVRMRPLPPAEGEGPATLDEVAGPMYCRLHIGDSLLRTGYRAWMRQPSVLFDTGRQVHRVGAESEHPAALIPPVQDGAGRLAFSLPAGRANRGGDGRRTQAALSAGGETHGSWHMQCMVERYKAVLPNAAVPYARVPERSLFAQGLAEPRAGHPRPYRGKRLRCTPAGGWAE